MARETGSKCLNFVPKTINLSRTTSSLTLNQLWVFTGKETRGFVSLESFKSNVNQNIQAQSKERFLDNGKRKHPLSIEERLEVIKTRIIKKQSVQKIQSEFNISSSLVYLIMKSYSEKGIIQLIAKKRERNLKNNLRCCDLSNPKFYWSNQNPILSSRRCKLC